MTVPPSVPKWFGSQYPTLKFAPQWLEECYTFLQENFQLTAPVLLKKIENQLLLSDLATSTVQHAGLFPTNDEQTEIIFADVKGAGVLVQVLEILEIGRPALELLRLHRDRVEDRKVFKEQGRAVIRAVNDVDPTQDGNNHNDGQDAAAAGEAEPQNKDFPRAMLRLRVSDGFNEYVAIETKRIPNLSMDETPLGCKLMLKNVRCQRGVLMINEACCIVKGGSIPDLENDRDALFEAWLEARIRAEDSLVTRPLQRQVLPGARRSVATANSASMQGTSAPNGPPAPSRAPLAQGRTVPTASTSTTNGQPQASTSAISSRPRAVPPAAHPPKQTIPEDDEFDFDDGVFEDEEALAALEEAEGSGASRHAHPSRGSTVSSITNNRQPSRPAAESFRASLVSGNNRQAPTAQQPSRSLNSAQARTSLVIDIDDSSDNEDAEIASMLLSESSQGGDHVSHTRGPAMNASRARTNQPIELD